MFITYKKQFLDHLKTKNKSRRTIHSYAGDLAQLETFWQALEHNARRGIGVRSAVEQFLAYLHRQDAHAHSIARKCSCLNSFKKYVQAYDETIEFHVKRPAYTHSTPTILSREDITYLLDTLPAEELDSRHPYRDRAILELLYATGITASEMTSIRIKDIDITQYTIYITRNHRSVFFGTKAREKIRAYMTYERNPHNEYAYAFVNHHCEPLTTRSIQRICRIFSQHLSSGKIITPHVLRHSFAYHLLEQGADQETVQHLLGNKTRLSIERYIQLVYSSTDTKREKSSQP